jgi:ribose transport system permease protein
MTATETVDPPARAEESRSGFDLGDFLGRFGLLLVWLSVAIVFAALEPDTFLTKGTFSNIFGSQAVLLVLALALLLPFSAGEYDLSVSGVLSITLVLIGWLNVVKGWPIVPVVAVVLALGVLIGAVNAFFVVVVGVDSLVVTLGMGTLLSGAGFGINIATTGGISSAVQDVFNTQLLSLPLAFYYGVVLMLGLWYLFRYTPLGRYLYFVGSGRDVARLAGVRVDLIRAGSLMASGLIAAFAGVMLAGTLGAADPNIAQTYLLPAFAAAFLGATAINPGRFNPIGTFIAVYFLVTGITGLQLLGLAGWIGDVFYGASLILAVSFSHLAARRRRAE